MKQWALSTHTHTLSDHNSPMLINQSISPRQKSALFNSYSVKPTVLRQEKYIRRRYQLLHVASSLRGLSKS